MPAAVDILLVSPGTTSGWREADRALADAMRSLGLSVAVARPTFRLARHLRRGILATDLVEAAASRRAASQALGTHQPRAIVFSTVQATMLQPRRRLRGAAVRFDAPPSLNRRTAGARLLRMLERRGLSRAALLLPYGLRPAEQIRDAIDVDASMISLPVPIEGLNPLRQRQPIALAYAGNPGKKGLDMIVRAWEQADCGERRLVVAGIAANRGRAFLRGQAIAEPPAIEWAGVLGAARFRALVSRAELFLSASRYEDYGQSQLEALAGGALLVTSPSPGPYEALGLARELDANLVAADMQPASLAAALEEAIGRAPQQRSSYRERAAALTAAYSAHELRRRLRRDVLPVLLGDR
ncbi:MAG: glycosyltransferase [Solirubrobacterales bacterium]